MDPRLSKGLTREGFRRDFKPDSRRVTSMEGRLGEFILELAGNGTASKRAVSGFVDAEVAAKSNPHELLVMSRVKNPGSSQLTQRVSQSLTGGYFIPAKGMTDGNEECLRQYVMFHDEVSRVSFDARYLKHSIFVRQHAISRFIERDGGGYSQVTAALWPGFLVLELMNLWFKRGAPRPFVLPTPNGFFLGVTSWRGGQGPKVGRQYWSRGRILSEERSLATNGRWPTHQINTFVSANESYLAQDEVVEAVRDVVIKHEKILKGIHFMDVLRFPSKSDSSIIHGLVASGDFDDLRNDTRRLFESALWRDQVRLPR